MSISITISADSFEQLSSHLASLAARFSSQTTSLKVWHPGYVEERPVVNPAEPKAKPEAGPVVKGPVVEPVVELVVEPVSKAPPVKVLAGYPDFDTEVTPKVLGYVRHKGKEWVSGILAGFGVKRASELNQDQLVELLSTLEREGGALPD